MLGIRFSDDFKRDAVSQVVERGYSIRHIAERLGSGTKSLYTWKTQFSKPDQVLDNEAALTSIHQNGRQHGDTGAPQTVFEASCPLATRFKT